MNPSIAKAESASALDARFRTMADHAPVLLWMARTDGLCDFFNQGWLDFTGRTLEEELGNGWAEGVHPEDFQASMQIYLEAFVARRRFSMEYRLRRRDGEYRWIFDQGAPRFEADGTFSGFIGSCVDVTAQRQAQEALVRLNDVLESQVRERTAIAHEREVLLREVHHRIKNDLQLISSMLSMQARQLLDPASIAALEECQGRVQTVAWIHENMYRSENLARMPFSANMRSLATSVFRVAGMAAGAVALEVEAEEEIALGVECAIPCGLIVNELVTNALKHAFPSGRHGTVRVSVGKQGPEKVAIVVADDGVGFSQLRAENGADSLGWRLVHAFAEQLHAEVSITHDGGTRVAVVFDPEG
jgi:PAS domain S-box-containing protein